MKTTNKSPLFPLQLGNPVLPQGHRGSLQAGLAHHPEHHPGEFGILDSWLHSLDQSYTRTSPYPEHMPL